MITSILNRSEFVTECLTAESIIRNTELVIDYTRQSNPTIANFWEGIKQLQYPEITTDIPSKSPYFIWDAGNTEFKSVLMEVMAVEELPEDCYYSKSETAIFQEQSEAGLALFQKLFPETYDAFGRAIPYILIGKRQGYGGGSVSTNIGIIWLSPTVNWTKEDWAENLIHEFIHNCLFLEDLVDNIFPFSANRMEMPDAQVISAIRMVKRAYDKSYHSAFVAYGIAEYYLRSGNFKKAQSIIEPLLVSLDDLSRNHNFLSANGIVFLNELVRGVIEQTERIPAFNLEFA